MPPGRARLAIRPDCNAPAPPAMTIGTVLDSRQKACAAEDVRADGDIGLQRQQFARQPGQPLDPAVAPAQHQRIVPPLGIAVLAHALAQRVDPRAMRVLRAMHQNGDERTPRLRLRSTGETNDLQREQCPAQDARREEIHSITSSARTRMDCGIVMPRALAVLRLTTSSNRVGCSTGKSAGLAPLNILPTKCAARRQISRVLAE